MLFAFAFVLAFPYHPYPDLFWQLFEGRSIAHGHFPTSVPYAIEAGPWHDHEWLFELIAWHLHAREFFPTFAALCATTLAALPLIGFAIARRLKATRFVALSVAWLLIIPCTSTYALRPQSFAEVLFALELGILFGSLRRPWLLLPITALWANLHASVVLAPATVLLVLIGRTIEHDGDVRCLTAESTAFCFALLGSILSPLGVNIFSYAITLMMNADVTTHVAEWHPASFAYISVFVTCALFAAIFVTGGIPAKRGNAVALVLLVVFGLAWGEHARLLPFFVLASIPALTIAVARGGHEERSEAKKLRKYMRGSATTPWGISNCSPWMLLAPAALIIAAFIVGNRTFDAGIKELSAADVLVREAHVRGNVVADFKYGGYLAWRDEPVRVLIDSHADPYPHDVWEDYYAVTELRPGWRGVLARRRISAVLLPTSSPLIAALSDEPGWQLKGTRDGVTLIVSVGTPMVRALGD
jgi:hypothetical protein